MVSEMLQIVDDVKGFTSLQRIISWAHNLKDPDIEDRGGRSGRLKRRAVQVKKERKHKPALLRTTKLMNHDFLQMFSGTLYHPAVTNPNPKSTYPLQYHFHCSARSSSLSLSCLTVSPTSLQCLLLPSGQEELTCLQWLQTINILIIGINLHVSTDWPANRPSKAGNCNWWWFL